MAKESIGIIKPKTKIESLDVLSYINDYKDDINSKFNLYGAVILKGFSIRSPLEFEKCAFALEPELKNDYWGTSPRNKITDYTFSASELPPHYPIMQHCEMSFLPHPPRKLMFFCDIAPQDGGETPLCDFGLVADNLKPEIKHEFEKKGVLNIRNYSSKASKNTSLRQLKPWEELFQTSEKELVEKISADNGLQVNWGQDNNLQLVNKQEAFRVHEKLNKKIWFNHTQVFHRDAAYFEYLKILQYRPGLRSAGLVALLGYLKFYEKYVVSSKFLPMNCMFGDGSEIPSNYIKELIETIWSTIIIQKWEKSDLLLIDNLRIAHGRLPYKGNRNILVSWSS